MLKYLPNGNFTRIIICFYYCCYSKCQLYIASSDSIVSKLRIFLSIRFVQSNNDKIFRSKFIVYNLDIFVIFIRTWFSSQIFINRLYQFKVVRKWQEFSGLIDKFLINFIDAFSLPKCAVVSASKTEHFELTLKNLSFKKLTWDKGCVISLYKLLRETNSKASPEAEINFFRGTNLAKHLQEDRRIFYKIHRENPNRSKFYLMKSTLKLAIVFWLLAVFSPCIIQKLRVIDQTLFF